MPLCLVMNDQLLIIIVRLGQRLSSCPRRGSSEQGFRSLFCGGFRVPMTSTAQPDARQDQAALGGPGCRLCPENRGPAWRPPSTAAVGGGMVASREAPSQSSEDGTDCADPHKDERDRR